MAEELDVNQLLANEYEPLRKFRWILSLEGIDAFTAKTITKPKHSLGETKIDWINMKRYIAGKGDWQPIDIELNDPIAPQQSQKVLDWLRLVVDWETGRMGYAAVYKKEFLLKELDPGGRVVSIWKCIGGWPKEIDFGGQLDMASDDVTTVKFTIRADRWQKAF